MNSAEARAARAYLSISVADMARIFDVDERSVRRWESPANTKELPAGLAQEIWTLLYKFARAVEIPAYGSLESTFTMPHDRIPTRPAWLPDDLPAELAIPLAGRRYAARYPVQWERAAYADMTNDLAGPFCTCGDPACPGGDDPWKCQER